MNDADREIPYLATKTQPDMEHTTIGLAVTLFAPAGADSLDAQS